MSFLSEVAQTCQKYEALIEGLILVMEDRIKEATDTLALVENKTTVYLVDGSSMTKEQFVTEMQAEIDKWQAVIDMLKQ